MATTNLKNPEAAIEGYGRDRQETCASIPGTSNAGEQETTQHQKSLDQSKSSTTEDKQDIEGEESWLQEMLKEKQVSSLSLYWSNTRRDCGKSGGSSFRGSNSNQVSNGLPNRQSSLCSPLQEMSSTQKNASTISRAIVKNSRREIRWSFEYSKGQF